MATSDSRIHAVGVSQTRHRLHTHLTTAGAEFTKDDETSPEKPSSAWISVAIVSLGLLLVTTSGIAFYA